MKIKILNKNLALISHKGTPEIIPNPFEFAKQYCLYNSEKGNQLPLPRSIGGNTIYSLEDSYPDLIQWFEALSSPCWRNHIGFREIVEPLDFSKPYDENIINYLNKTKVISTHPSVITTDDLINAELDII